jgi:DNA-binding LacI/PurR family transcriptional regulator
MANMTATSGRKSVVIADVARVAGVSVPTVSRVLTGAAKVSPEKFERVQRAIEELNYRPSSAARALVHGRSEMIAIVAGDTSRYGYAMTIRGIELAARASGYVVLIVVLEGTEEEVVQPAIDLLLSQPLAGIVALQFDTKGVNAVKRLPSWIPLVAVSGSRPHGISHAEIDELAGGEKLTDYLLDLGHRTVHHVSIPETGDENGRTSGWRRALERRGIEPPQIVRATWEPQSGVAIGRDLAGDPSVTAVFCGNDEIAMGVMKGLAESGKSVPGDVSVVGFDNHPLSELWTPALTTIEQDFVDLGRRAFEMLLARVEGRTADDSTFSPRIVIRDSAGPRAAE